MRLVKDSTAKKTDKKQNSCQTFRAHYIVGRQQQNCHHTAESFATMRPRFPVQGLRSHSIVRSSIRESPLSDFLWIRIMGVL